MELPQSRIRSRSRTVTIATITICPLTKPPSTRADSANGLSMCRSTTRNTATALPSRNLFALREREADLERTSVLTMQYLHCMSKMNCNSFDIRSSPCWWHARFRFLVPCKRKVAVGTRRYGADCSIATARLETSGRLLRLVSHWKETSAVNLMHRIGAVRVSSEDLSNIRGLYPTLTEMDTARGELEGQE